MRSESWSSGTSAGAWGLAWQDRLRTMSDWADWSFLDGHGPEEGEKLIATVMYHHTEWLTNGKLPLPVFRQSMKG